MERTKALGAVALAFLAGFLVALVVGPLALPAGSRLEAATAPPPPPSSPVDLGDTPQVPPEVAQGKIESLEKRVAELEKHFAKHTHEFAGYQPERVTYYENMLRYPETYRNALIPYRVSPANRPTLVLTGPPKY